MSFRADASGRGRLVLLDSALPAIADAAREWARGFSRRTVREDLEEVLEHAATALPADLRVRVGNTVADREVGAESLLKLHQECFGCLLDDVREMRSRLDRFMVDSGALLGPTQLRRYFELGPPDVQVGSDVSVLIRIRRELSLLLAETARAGDRIQKRLDRAAPEIAEHLGEERMTTAEEALHEGDLLTVLDILESLRTETPSEGVDVPGDFDKASRNLEKAIESQGALLSEGERSLFVDLRSSCPVRFAGKDDPWIGPWRALFSLLAEAVEKLHQARRECLRNMEKMRGIQPSPDLNFDRFMVLVESLTQKIEGRAGSLGAALTRCSEAGWNLSREHWNSGGAVTLSACREGRRLLQAIALSMASEDPEQLLETARDARRMVETVRLEVSWRRRWALRHDNASPQDELAERDRLGSGIRSRARELSGAQLEAVCRGYEGDLRAQLALRRSDHPALVGADLERIAKKVRDLEMEG